jgi:hypothetical protein
MEPNMSDMLTHWASFDDCRRLAQLDDSLIPEFRKLIEEQRHFARLGTLSFGGTTWMQPVLDLALKNWSDPKRDLKHERNVAFVLGGLIHQACDRVMKPILTNAAGVDWNNMQFAMQGDPSSTPVEKDEVDRTQEVSAYFDAEVFRQVYLNGHEEPFTPLFLGETTKSGGSLEEVIRALFQRALLSCHTLKPDSDNMEAWLDDLAAKVQPLYLEVDRWVSVFQSPDPKKIEAYGVRSTFYDASDPTICLARGIQSGENVTDELRQRVLVRGEFTCAYGDILQHGLRYLRGASSYWRGDSDTIRAENYVTP